MPMSPSSFVPSERLQPGDGAYSQAPQVRPETNYAPQQIEQAGQALSGAGSVALRTGQSMAYRIGETIDDANTKAAETGFLTAATGVTRSYLQTRGKDAMDGYNDATQNLAKAADQGRTGLTNPIQQRMYNQSVAMHLANFGGQMADHNHQQTVTYSAGEANSRSDSYAQQAALAYQSRDAVDKDGNPAGDFLTYWNVAVSEAEKAAQAGLGAPPGSAQSKALVKSKTTEMVRGVISRLMDDHANVEAKAFYEQELAAGNIDERQAEAMSNTIKTQADRDDTVDTADSMIQAKLASHVQGAPSTASYLPPIQGGSITSVMGEPRPDGRTHNGIDIGIPAGTEVKAPADGTVRVFDDTQFGGGHSMEIQHKDGSITGFAHLGTTAYQNGAHVTQGQVVATVAKAGTKEAGNATGDSLHWNLKDSNGKYVDPRYAGGVPQKLENFTDPNDLDDLLQQVDGSDRSPYQKKELKSQLESQYRHYRQIDDQKYEDNKKSVVDAWYAADGDVSKFNPAQLAQFSQLRPGDQAQLKKGIPQESDEDTVLNLMAHPELVVPGSVEKYRDQLSKVDYRRFFEQAQVNANPNSLKVQSVSQDRNKLDTLLSDNGMPELVDPTMAKNPKAATQKMHLVSDIDDQINVEQARLGRELSRDEKTKIMTDAIGTLNQKVTVPSTYQAVSHFLLPWSERPGVQQTYSQLTPGEKAKAWVMVGDQKVMLGSIPDAERQAIVLNMNQANVPVTWQGVAERYIRKQQKDKVANPAPAVTPPTTPEYHSRRRLIP